MELNTNTKDILAKDYKKTNKLSLHYKINNITNNLDSNDLPITEDEFQYSIEEVLIKLYGLKRRLKETYLPFNVNITDITGEASYFYSLKESVNTLYNKSDKLKLGIIPDFKILSTNEYIIDLRSYDDIAKYEFYPYYIDHNMDLSANYTIEELKDILLVFFKHYYPGINTIENIPDNVDISVGCPIVLQNTSFNLAWDDITTTYSELEADLNYYYDFYVSNPSLNDVFRITDNISNTYIEYIATLTDTNIDVNDNLKIIWESQIDSPWKNFEVSTINASIGYVLRVKSISISSLKIQHDFQVNSSNGIGLNNQQLIKYIMPINSMYTFDRIQYNNYYEIEWYIHKDEDNDTAEFNYNIRGDIDYYNTVSVVLPYIGSYNIELSIYNTFGQQFSINKNSIITVKPKSIDFCGYYTTPYKENTFNNLDKYTYDDIHSLYNLPLVNNHIKLDDIKIAWDSLDKSILLEDDNIQNYKSDGSISNPGAYTWNNLYNNTMNDMDSLYWDSIKLSGDTPMYFNIIKLYNNAVLKIKNSEEQNIFYFSSTDLQIAVNELNNSTDNIISNYVYNYVNDENDNANSYIHAVGKFNTTYNDSNLIEGINLDFGSSSISRLNNVTYNTIDIIYSDCKVLPILTAVTFTYDICKFPGKNLAIWKVKNNTTLEEFIFYKKRLNYLFKDKGKFTISLYLSDANGNNSYIEKNIVIIS